MWINRNYSDTVKRLSQQFPAVLLCGPRRIGKTELAKRLFPKAQYLSLDDPSLAAQAEENPNDFFETLKEPVILDEVQYAPKLIKHLQEKIRELPKPGRFILISTRNFSLLPDISESLAEYGAIVEMRPFSFEEISSTISLSDTEYLVRGGFPELYHEDVESVSEWYGKYVTQFIEKDVRNIKNIGNIRDFEKFMRATALRNGQILSYSDLARDVKIAPNTAKMWVKILQASGIIYLLDPCPRIHDRKRIKSPKLLLADTGLASYLAGITSWNDLQKSPLGESFWQCHVVNQWIRHYSSQGIHMPPLSYWRTIYGDEVPLLIDQGGQFIGVDCTISEHPEDDILKGFQSFQKNFGAQTLIRGYIACRTPKVYRYPPYPYFAIPGSRKVEETFRELGIKERILI